MTKATAAPLQGLATYLAKALVDDPTPVEVFAEGDDVERTFRLKVGSDDLGKVIGKKGRTAKALRTLMAAAGAKQDMRVGLEIIEPDREERAAKRARANTPAEDAPPDAPPDAAPAASADASKTEDAPADDSDAGVES